MTNQQAGLDSALRTARRATLGKVRPLEKMAVEQEKERKLNANKSFLMRYPWLWGVTEKWFLDRDHIEGKGLLTAEILKPLRYSRISDAGGSSWFAYQRLRNNLEQVARVGEDGSPVGTAIAGVARNYPGVFFLIEFAWVGEGNQAYRHFTLYEIPRGTSGSKLRELCDKALKPAKAGKGDAA